MFQRRSLVLDRLALAFAHCSYRRFLAPSVRSSVGTRRRIELFLVEEILRQRLLRHGDGVDRWSTGMGFIGDGKEDVGSSSVEMFFSTILRDRCGSGMSGFVTNRQWCLGGGRAGGGDAVYLYRSPDRLCDSFTIVNVELVVLLHFCTYAALYGWGPCATLRAWLH